MQTTFLILFDSRIGKEMLLAKDLKKRSWVCDEDHIAHQNADAFSKSKS